MSASSEHEPERVPEPSFWTTVLEALRGSEQDLTAIPIGRAVLLLAVPTVLEMSMESLFAIVDIFVVARLGSAAVATVGLTESMISPVYAIAMGLSAAATAIVSRRTGEKDKDGAAAAAAQVILLAVVLATIVGGLGGLFAKPLLGLMGADPEVLACSSYTAILLGGSVTILLLFVINAIFRSAGDPVIAMRALWIANGLNIALAPCLVFGLGPFPRLGVAGAAIATTLSRGVGVAYQALVLRRGRDRLPMGRRHFPPQPSLLAEIGKLASSAGMQVLIETASWLGLVRILSTFGSVALAGYTIAMRVAIFALLPSWGLAGSAATLVGQNLGAKSPERARKAVWTVARYNGLFLTAIGAVFILTPHVLIGAFTSDVAAIAFGEDCLRIVAFGFVAFAFGMVTIQAFNGAGDTVTPMLINLGVFWAIKIPVAYTLARTFGLGPRGVFIAITVAYSLQALISGLLFRRGRWQLQKV